MKLPEIQEPRVLLHSQQGPIQKKRAALLIMGDQMRLNRCIRFGWVDLVIYVLLFARVLAAPSDTAGSMPRSKDLQSLWQFICYSPGCSDSTSRGRSSSTTGCNKIDSSSCNQFFFNGGGQYKLCLYVDNDCWLSNRNIDGGVLGCTGLDPWTHSWKVVIRGHGC